MHIVVKGEITVTEPNEAKRNKSAVFKNNTPFINCISKIDDVQIDNQLVEKNPEKQQAACGIITDMNPAILSSNSESFKYKTSITGNTHNAGAGPGESGL